MSDCRFRTPQHELDTCLTRLSSPAGQIQQPVKQGLGFSKAPRCVASWSFLLLLAILIQLSASERSLLD